MWTGWGFALLFLLLPGHIWAGRVQRPAEALHDVTEGEEIAKLIKQLRSTKTADRDAATRRLIQIGETARPQLEAALEKEEEFVRRRIDIILRGFDARVDRASQDEQKAMYQAFIDGSANVSLPGWRDFLHMVGGGISERCSRKLFLAMYQAEPELLDAYENQPEKVAELLERRLYWYESVNELGKEIIIFHAKKQYVPKEVLYEVNKRTPASILAFFFVAGNGEIKVSDNSNRHLQSMMKEGERSAPLSKAILSIMKPIFREEEKAHARISVRLIRWKCDTMLRPGFSIGWLRRPFWGDPRAGDPRVNARVVAAVCGAMKGELPFLISLLDKPWNWDQHPQVLLAIGYLGDRTHIAAIEPLLTERAEKIFRYKGSKLRVQICDLALAALAELCGQRPEVYGLTATDAANLRRDHKDPVDKFYAVGRHYYFQNAGEREQGLAKWHSQTDQ